MVQQHVGLAHCYNAQLLLDRVRAKPTSAGSGPLGTGHGKQQLFFLWKGLEDKEIILYVMYAIGLNWFSHYNIWK